MFRNIKRNQEYFSKIFKPGCSIIIFDTETTGLGKNAKIIEFGAVRFLITTKGLKETGKMDLFINPEETLFPCFYSMCGNSKRKVKNNACMEKEESNIGL